MDTFFARNRLSAYLDGALPPAEAREVASAIERDPELASEYEALRRTVALLQQEGPAKAPAGFHARVMGKLAEERPPTGTVVKLRRWFARLPVEAVALAAAAAVVVVAIQWQPSPEPEPGEERSAAAAPEPTKSSEEAAPKELAPVAQREATTAEKNLEATPAEPPAVAEATPAPSGGKRRPKAAQSTKEYVPDWEAPQTAAVASVRGLRLVVSNPEVLHQLEQLARQSDGRLTDGQGRATRARSLSADEPQATVMLVVPAHRANELQAQLQGFGAQSGAAPSGLMVGNGNAGFYLDVRLQSDSAD
jgi:negative regulator of sigma E activity